MSETSLDLRSRVTTDVDLQADGAQHGHLTIPHSRNDSPWGSILMPISVFRNGDGPTVLLTGGNHGDEYEGPIALMNLVRTLDASQVRGRVVVIPALNYPAVQAGTRLSPIDGRNMNRVFPGNRDGGVTEMIADFVQRRILPMCDAVVDIHSGGNAMRFAPCAVIHKLADRDQMKRTVALASAFGAPYALVLEELDATGMLDTAVEQMGKLFLSTELGGGGTTSVRTVRITEDGVWNVLIHLSLLDEPPPGRNPGGDGPTRFLETPDGAFVIADRSGLFETALEPESEVRAGEAIGCIHDLDRPSAAPAVYVSPLDGMIVQRHVAGRIQRGDCMCVVAVDWHDEAPASS